MITSYHCSLSASTKAVGIYVCADKFGAHKLLFSCVSHNAFHLNLQVTDTGTHFIQTVIFYVIENIHKHQFM